MSDLNIPLQVIERREESRDCQSIVFARPAGVDYDPGDWMDIRFPTPEFPVGRTYSFASAPTEPDLQITFKQGVSPFKQRLERTEPGEVMLITQYGSNGFRHDRRYPAVFIAGGVGVTPFRSMIKDLIDTGKEADVVLIHQHRTADFPFSEEIGGWAQRYPWLIAQFVTTSHQGRLTSRMLDAIVPSRNDWAPKYYLAGPPGMVDTTSCLLHELKVAQKDIATDRFDGY